MGALWGSIVDILYIAAFVYIYGLAGEPGTPHCL